MAVSGQLHISAALTQGKGHVTHCTGGWMGWTVTENLAPAPPPGFDPRTGLHVAIRYTVYAVPVHTYYNIGVYSRILCVFFESRELEMGKSKGLRISLIT
jgi:hypothetical protein